MAALQEMLELGLTEEDLENIMYMGNTSVSNSSSKTLKKTSNGVKHKKEKKRSPEKIGQKKKGPRVGYLKSPGSDSDSSSYESSDNFYSSPRGLQYGQSFHDIGGGRGKPFYPNAMKTRSLYNQGGDTYNHVNRMARDINPLIQMTGSTLFRNENIEKEWGKNKSAIPKTISNSLLPENNNIEREITVLPIIEPKRALCPVNIGKPLDSVTNSTREQTNSTREQPYKNALINVHKSETNSSGDDSLRGKFDRLSMKIPSNNCDNVDSDNSIRKKREDRVKTQLYIPPHMRKRIADSESSDLASDCSVRAIIPPVKHQTSPTNHNSEQPVIPKPAKKSMAELTRKNALISGLLRKKQEQQQQQLSSPSVQCHSSTFSSSLASTPPVSSEDHVISTSSLSSSCRPCHSDYCDTVPSQSEPSSPPPSSELLPMELAEFYDIEDPPSALVDTSPYSPLGERGELPLRPPPEFGGDDSEEYFFYDEDTKQFVYYRIPESPLSESSIGGSSSRMSNTAVNGSSSAFSTFNGVSFGQENTGGSNQISPSAVHRSSSSAFSSFNGSTMVRPIEHSLTNHGTSPPSNNPNHASYSSSARSPSSNNPNHASRDTRGPGIGFWPPPGSSDSEYYDHEYPTMS